MAGFSMKIFSTRTRRILSIGLLMFLPQEAFVSGMTLYSIPLEDIVSASSSVLVVQGLNNKNPWQDRQVHHLPWYKRLIPPRGYRPIKVRIFHLKVQEVLLDRTPARFIGPEIEVETVDDKISLLSR
jgi:hypothetical protein